LAKFRCLSRGFSGSQQGGRAQLACTIQNWFN
jgi:hypothetical protein